MIFSSRRLASLAMLALTGLVGCSDSLQTVLRNELVLESEGVDSLIRIVDLESAKAYKKGFQKQFTERNSKISERKIKQLSLLDDLATTFRCNVRPDKDSKECGTLIRGKQSFAGTVTCPKCGKEAKPPKQMDMWNKFFRYVERSVTMGEVKPTDDPMMLTPDDMEDATFCESYVNEKVATNKGLQRELIRLKGLAMSEPLMGATLNDIAASFQKKN